MNSFLIFIVSGRGFIFTHYLVLSVSLFYVFLSLSKKNLYIFPFTFQIALRSHVRRETFFYLLLNYGFPSGNFI